MGTQYITIDIDTGNAAFGSGNRGFEVARILQSAASRIADSAEPTEPFPLLDVNGNKVGTFGVADHALVGGKPGTFRLSVDTDNAAFDEGQAGAEIARILRTAGKRFDDGEVEFELRDVNGNSVGACLFQEAAGYKKYGTVNMESALAFGDVYLAEEGFEGIADGEFRYVVPTPDFEPGYGQESGEAWLVNAKGEIAPGYEDGATVRERDFRSLKPAEKAELREVIEGRVSFEEFERKFAGDDVEPGP